MAIDFPSNPTNGQVYGNWIFDSSITAWRNVNTDTGIGTLNAIGLKNVVPTSVSVSTGSATVNSNGTVTFTNATDVYLAGIFTSTYKNYKAVISFTSSAGSEIAGWFTNSGANITTGWYGAAFQTTYNGTSSVSNPRSNGNGGWIMYNNTEGGMTELGFYTDTVNSRLTYQILASSKPLGAGIFGGYGTTGTAQGFRFSPLTGGVTMTGTATFYGYNN